MSKGSKKLSAQEEQTILQSFLVTQNRPYSVQNMVDALQKHAIKKTGVERALALLLKKGIIIKKEYGKAKIFLVNQDGFEKVDVQGMKELEGTIRKKEEVVEGLKEEVDNMDGQVRDLQRELTLKQAKVREKELIDEIAVVQEKVDKVKGGKAISKEDMDNVKMRFGKMKSEWKKRKGYVMEVLNVISEASGKKMKDLIKDSCIETDEQVGVDFKKLPNVVVPKPSAKAKKETVLPAKRKRNDDT